MTMTGFAFSEHRSGCDIERGEQGGCPIANVIMSDTLDIAKAHGQYRLSTIRGLNRLFRRHRAPARDPVGSGRDRRYAHFLDEEWIVGELESAAPMGLDRECLKQPMHGRSGIPLVWAASRILQCVPRRLYARATLQQSDDLFILDAAGTTGPQLIVKSGQTPLDGASPPLSDRCFGPRNRPAISVLLRPWANQSTTLARATSACGKRREAGKLSSWVCSLTGRG